MSDRVNLLQRAENVEVSPLFNTYAKVIVNIDDETQASSGSGAGRVLEIDNPLFGSATVASRMLARLSGYQYQPFTATGALLDPAAEMGDGISVNGVYGGLYARDRRFSHLMDSDIAAPHDEEINHEYQYETPTERKLKREMGDVRATFAIQSDKIEARVAKTGGNNSSFGWVLNDTSHTWYSGNKQVMNVNSSGLEVSGKITATSGYIGTSTNGFTISARAIYNGMTSLTDTTHNGVYIGTNGIALGKGNFKVDTAGNVTAKKLTLDTLVIGGTNVSASTLNSRANSAYTSTSSGGYCYGGAGAGYSAQNTWNDAQNPSAGINYMKVNTLVVPNAMTIGAHGVGAYTATISGVTIPYFGWGPPY